MTTTIRPFIEDDIHALFIAFQKIGWNKSTELFKRYLAEQQTEKRHVYIAMKEGEICGYVSILWKSSYPGFLNAGIPEISDLNVLPKFRRQRIASQLIQICEKTVLSRGIHELGLGVGLTENYGAAQRLYIKLGYQPDGKGIFYKHKPVEYFSLVKADDDLVLFLVKKFSPHSS